MTQVGAIKRRGAVDQAYKHVVRRLDLREFLPGDRLPAATLLAEEIGVSRVAVLQALQILQSEGRLLVRPGRGGARVAPTDASHALRFALKWAVRADIKDIHPLYEVVMQGVGGYLARRGMDPDDLATCHALLDEIAITDDVDRRLALENRFFDIIGRATNTTMLNLFVTLTRQHVSSIYDLIDIPDDRPAQWLELERGLLRAIERSETGTASDMMSWLFGDLFALVHAKFELDDVTRESNASAHPNGTKAKARPAKNTTRKAHR